MSTTRNQPFISVLDRRYQYWHITVKFNRETDCYFVSIRGTLTYIVDQDNIVWDPSHKNKINFSSEKMEKNAMDMIASLRKRLI